MNALSPVEAERPFIARAGMAVAAAAAIAFAAYLALAAFGDEWRSGHDGGAHALSVSGTGFSGIVELLGAARPGPPRIARDPFAVARAPLLVVTPPVFGGNLRGLLDKRDDQLTLVVAPKWNTVADPTHPGWVRAAGLIGPFAGAALSALGKSDDSLFQVKVTVSGKSQKPKDETSADEAARQQAFTTNVRNAHPGERLRWPDRDLDLPAPRKLQTVASTLLEPLLVTRGGGIVLGKLKDRPVFVLADPDLIDNQALATLTGAQNAVALFDQLPSGEQAVFDVTLNGYERSPNLLRLALTPPFLPATLCLLAAALLALALAAARFGPRTAASRAFAYGSRALIDNAADLIAQARREGRFAGRYAAIVRDRILARGLVPDAEFDRLAEVAARAVTGADGLAAARALHRWKDLHDGR